MFDNSLVSERVAVSGMNVSRSLDISNLSEPAVIFRNGIRFSVIGIFSKSQGLSAPGSATHSVIVRYLRFTLVYPSETDSSGPVIRSNSVEPFTGASSMMSMAAETS